MTESEIISAGQWAISKYDTSEFREALYKAFVRDRMKHIRLRNSKNESQFLAACAAWGIEQGWLRETDLDFYDEQDAGYAELFLTDEGKAEFGLTQ